MEKRCQISTPFYLRQTVILRLRLAQTHFFPARSLTRPYTSANIYNVHCSVQHNSKLEWPSQIFVPKFTSQ